MDINRLVVKDSWNQGLAGMKTSSKKNVSLGNFRLVNNMGLVNKDDKSTNTNHKWVSDSSEFTRFRGFLSKHKSLVYAKNNIKHRNTH